MNGKTTKKKVRRKYVTNRALLSERASNAAKQLGLLIDRVGSGDLSPNEIQEELSHLEEQIDELSYDICE